MKNNRARILVISLVCVNFGIKAQEKPSEDFKKTNLNVIRAEKPSVIFKFEPDYLVSVESGREQQKRNREILDTLSISERKKKKLLKKMFKSDFLEHLSKTRVVDTKFEDVDE
ncbi:hypothetical protein [Maribacter sp.]|uniref:hypothetical protein n=1 Tax=Maribacter sp. TaxID=1897614 RepID=UPI0025C6B6C1|nr:hypothetical protein [Maribacter sp.]